MHKLVKIITSGNLGMPFKFSPDGRHLAAIESWGSTLNIYPIADD